MKWKLLFVVTSLFTVVTFVGISSFKHLVISKSYDRASYEVESFKDDKDFAPLEIDNSKFLLPGVHGRG